MKVHILVKHLPAGRMDIRAAYADEDDANRLAAISPSMRVQTLEVIEASKGTGHQDEAGGPSSTQAASSA